MKIAKRVRDHVEMTQRFSMAMARAQSCEQLVAGMLAACVVSMKQLGPEGMQEVRRLIDDDQVRVLK